MNRGHKLVSLRERARRGDIEQRRRLLWQSSYGQGAGVSAQTPQLMGVNLNYLNYWTEAYPFLNVCKQAGSNDFQAWTTYGGVSPTGGGSGDIQVDSDDYPTSMQGYSGQTFTKLEAMIFVNNHTLTGASSRYPLGPYRFRFTGRGKITFSTGFTSIQSVTTTGGAGTATFAGLTVDSTATSGNAVTTVMITTYDGSGGMRFDVNAIPSATDYPRAMELVQQSKTTKYDAGQIFSDEWLALHVNFTSFRTKDWMATDVEMMIINFQATLAIGVTTAPMRAYNWSTSAWEDFLWTYPSGTYLMTTKNGDQFNFVATWNSATVTFPSLTAAITFDGTTNDRQCFMSRKGDWSKRAKFSNFSWSNYNEACPLEVCWTACNLQNGGAGIDDFCAMPARVGTPTGIDATYVNGLINLAHSGLGTTMPGFTGLKKLLRIEYSNEGWNFAAPYASQWAYAIALAKKLCPGATDTAAHEYRAAMVALIGDAMFAIYGSVDFAARCRATYGGQFTGGGANAWGAYYTNLGMRASHWAAGPAYTHHINALNYAPYIGLSINDGDPTQSLTTIQANAICATVDPIDTIFGLAYSGTYNGCDISNNYPNGWVQKVIDGAVTQFAAQNAALPALASLEIVCYESGTDFAPQNANPVAWQNLCVNMHRDERLALLYYDPANAMFNTYGYAAANGKPGYLPAMRAVGILYMHQLTDIQPLSPTGGVGMYGMLEGSLCPFSPLSAALPKYRGIQKYATGAAS